MYSLFFEVLDDNGVIVKDKCEGIRASIVPRIHELYILKDEVYQVTNVIYDLDKEELVVYLFVKYVQPFKREQDKPIVLH